MSASTRAFKVAFRCTACGKCCTGKGGKVRVNAREVEAIADHLSTPTREFRRQFLRRHPGDDFDSIKQTPDDLQCIFLEGKQCSIYPVRPTQCQTYPFWPQQLISKYDWALTSKECEGVLLDRTSDADIVPNDRILKETVIHEVHRSGESMTYSEIESLVEELDPDMLHAFDQEVADKYRRDVVYEDEHVVVLDSFLDTLPPTRSLHFTDRLELVQSEVFLTPEGAVDHSYLSLDVHRGLSVALGFLQDDPPPSSPSPSAVATDPTWRVAMLGAGASVLPTFWQHVISRHRPVRIHVVEPSAAMLYAGTHFFDASDALVVHKQTGNAFVTTLLESSAELLDLVVVDVEDGTTHELLEHGDVLSAPPASMTSKEFLHNIRRVLGPRGVVAMNVIGHKPTGSLESAGGWDGLATRLATVFDQVWVLPLEANTLVFGVLGWPSHVLPPLSTTSLSDQEQVVQDIFDEFRPRMRRVH
ncbi:hypothetical protein, variant [Aphanomyces astaci]|uniref:Uncharacterized protein n=1 Tax=Aphanomyces astaci TaxID=112090 RepID=W4FPI1_APHAT|nr:hypothetical protein, variant [Aphanomyces astaci]ETV69402.1 hypothetical protein, variant [Aphanomyces astaci]|eukprot:XP_009841259.1 hypothetical protein, variant [Aphanomyces astaci]